MSARLKRNGIDVELPRECVAKLMDVVSCHYVIRRGLVRGPSDGWNLFR